MISQIQVNFLITTKSRVGLLKRKTKIRDKEMPFDPCLWLVSILIFGHKQKTILRMECHQSKSFDL